jgi:hypothetical protein
MFLDLLDDILRLELLSGQPLVFADMGLEDVPFGK